MAEYLSPGVFTEERPSGVAPIQGVSTSTYATCGWTSRGPVGVATLVSSLANFIDTFGSYWANSYIPYAMAAFFGNGGARAYMVREVPSDAVKASGEIEEDDRVGWVTGMGVSDPITSLDATHYNVDIALDGGASGGDIDVTGDSGVAGSYALSTIVSNINTALGVAAASVYTDVNGYKHIAITSLTPGATSDVEFVAPTGNDCTDLLLGLNTSSYPHNFAGAAATNRWDLTADSEGAWGNLVQAVLQGNDDYIDQTNGGWTKFNFLVYEESADGEADYELKETHGPVNLTDDTQTDYFMDVVNNDSDLVDVAEGSSPGIPFNLAPVTWTARSIAIGDAATVTFAVTLMEPVIVRNSITITDGTETFTDDGAGTLTGSAGGSGTVNYNTGAVSVTFNAAPGSGTLVTATYKQQSTALTDTADLASGADGTGPLTRTEVSDPALQATERGIYAFDKIEEVLNVSLPDFAGSATVAADLISWAETQKDRFIILDPAVGLTPQECVDYRRYTGNFNTSYSALYYPWVTIADPLWDNRAKNIPPSGFIAGVYARTDQNRNVGKAPAGITDGKILGAIGVERILSKAERDILYPAQVNPIADTTQTGRAVWGARSLSLDSEWRYINARRLFMFCEKSVFLSIHWAVFENNGPGLWARIRLALTSFLLRLHDDGYFAGTTPSDSFKVVCDSTNNSQANIDAGIVTVDVYIAPNKPAEFVRIRWQQKVNQAA